MRKLLFFSSSLFIGLILFFIAIKKIGTRNIILAISEISFWQFLVILAIFLLSFFVGTFRWRTVLKNQVKNPVSFSDIFIARIINSAINQITPVFFLGGQPFQVYVIKERAKIPLDKAVASTIIAVAIFLSILFFFVILGVVFLFLLFPLPLFLKFSIGGILALCSVIFCLFYSRIIKKNPGQKGFFTFFIEGFHLDKLKIINNIKTGVADVEKQIFYFFKHQRDKLVIASFFTILEILLLLFGYWLLVFFLGSKISLPEVFSVNALVNLAYLLPIPAGLGALEVSQALIFNTFGLGFNTGIAFSLIVRVVTLIIVGIGILFLIQFEIKIIVKRIGVFIERLIEFFKQ